MANYSCKKVFTNDLKLSHNTSVKDGQTNDNHANSSTVTYVRSAKGNMDVLEHIACKENSLCR